MDSKNVKLFDANGELVANFDEVIENILISVHGEKYFDMDETIKNTNEIPIVKEKIEKSNTKNKITFKDFIPVIFFIIIFIILLIAGYYFLNEANLKDLIS